MLDTCARHPDLTGFIGGVFSMGNSGGLFGYVPKAGCTFWKRVFILMNGKTPLTRESLFSIPRLEVHNIAAGGLAYSNIVHATHRFPIR